MGASSSWSRTFSTSYPSSWRRELRTTAFSLKWPSTAHSARPMAAAMRRRPSASSGLMVQISIVMIFFIQKKPMSMDTTDMISIAMPSPSLNSTPM